MHSTGTVYMVQAFNQWATAASYMALSERPLYKVAYAYDI